MALELDPKQFTPRTLANAIHSYENQLFGENAHKEAVEQVNQIITPLLDSLSVPERISRSTTFIDGERQEDLWRRILDYPPKFKINGEGYYVGVYQVIDANRNLRLIKFGTGRGPENIDLATLRPEGEFPKFARITGPRKVNANREEMEDIIELAKMIAIEAPKQAIENSLISSDWMAANRTTDFSVLPQFNSQDLPKPDSRRSDKPYELIKRDGSRVVANPDFKKNVWVNDVYQNQQIEATDVVGWRRLNSVVLPEYYSRLKYPNLYKS